MEHLQTSSKPTLTFRLPALVAGLAALAFFSWLLNTPAGLLGKADAVGYAICHRIDGRSFHLGNRQLPLCARCTGIYLGVLLGIVTLAVTRRGRAGALPPWKIVAVLVGFIALMGVDGVNSYLTLFPGLPHLYEPQNWLRLITGTLTGLTLAALIYPVFNQTLWRNWTKQPVLANFRELGGLLVLAAIVIGLVLSDNPIVLYPLALLSALGVVVLLTLLDTVILLMVIRRENRVERWTGVITPLLAGFTLAILQIGFVDAVRFSIFHTWGGLNILG
jgi:uncharacterized membrane protein